VKARHELTLFAEAAEIDPERIRRPS